MGYYPSFYYLRNGRLSEFYLFQAGCSSRGKNVVDERKKANKKIVRRFHARYAMQNSRLNHHYRIM